MNPDRWQLIKSAFSVALQLDPAKRAAYVEGIGATDPELQQRIASLLVQHEGDDDEFLKNPAVELDIYLDLIESDTDSWLGKSIGPYRLVRELGAGGMGEVYLAHREDAQFDQQVAIKLIRSGHESAAVVSRFKAERQILAGLDHPNIAKLLDGGRTSAGQPYFVMEYVPGPTITSYCEQKKLSIRERLELLIQACDAVQHAHRNAIIHRDLKPSNILVVEVDGRPVCRVIDFGLAKTTTPGSADQAQLTRLGLFMGTPGYMSPEQADLTERHVDTRTDVYSLGAILYKLLTGFHPFESVDHQPAPFDAWLRQLREATPPRPSSRRAEQGPVPADLDWITLKALERDRERRYGTPAELAADLRRFLHEEPVLARPPSVAYQVGKFVRRHRVAAGAAAAVVLALAAGLSMALWQAHVADTAARAARAQELDARAQAVKVRQISALSAEQAGDAASQLGFASTAVARLAYAVRLDPDNPTLRSHLLQLLDEQDIWWLPQPQSFRHSKVLAVQFSPDATRIATAAEDGSVVIWDLAAARQSGATIHHGGSIAGLEFSPDGERLVTGSADHTARVWDAVTGEPLGPPLVHAAEVQDAHFSHDGTRVVTASEDHTARVWDWRSGEVQGVPLRHAAGILGAQFSPDDARIVTASKDHSARIWDARTGRPLSPPLEHGDLVAYAEFSADGTRVLTSSADSTARVWDVRTGQPIGQPLRHTRVVRQAKFSPDGMHVMTWSWDRTLRIWDARSGAPRGEPMLLPLQVVTGFFSADSRLAFTVLQDGTVRAWEVATGRPLGAAVRLTTAEIKDADFNARANLLASVSRDGGVQLWSPRLGSKLRDPLRQDSAFRFIKFSPDGRRVITNSAGHTATIWDPGSGRALLAPLAHGGEVVNAEFSDDGTRIATVSADRVARIWNAASGASVGVPMVHEHEVSEARFSPNGTILLTTLADGTIRLWDSATGAARGAPLYVGDQDSKLAGSTAFSPDGARVASAANQTTSGTGTVRLWDVRTGKLIGSPMNHPTAVSDWRFSPDGTRIVTVSVASVAIGGQVGGQARTIRLWNAVTGAPLSEPTSYGDELAPPVQFSPDGTYFLIATMDAKAQAWNAFTGAALDRTFSQEAGLTDVNISGDGERVVTASMDQTARLWNATTGVQIGAPLHHDGVVWSARFSADGKRIATASGDRTAEVWDAQTLRPITGPMRHEWPVRFALLSPDGRYVTTISMARDRRRLWPVLSATAQEAPRLADFAEVMGGTRIDATGALTPVPDRVRLLERLRAGFDPAVKSPSDLDRIFTNLVLPVTAQAP